MSRAFEMEIQQDGHAGEIQLGYQHTLMYGRYIRTLAEEAKEEAKRAKEIEKRRKKSEKERAKELRAYKGKWISRCDLLFGWLWRNTASKLGEDAIFLAVLGIIVAIISFVQDFIVLQLNLARIHIYDLAEHTALKYFSWVAIPVFLVLFSAGFVHLVAPQAIGSGIPEMKTILRGIILKEYLSFRTVVAKCVGLTAVLGAGMPVGKEGPLVHIASIVATYMSKLVTSFEGIYENESRKTEMLAAACAVGVSCCFGAPIGGVLFSIEVTSVFFAIRNYWRGFFSAVFGALTFRLFSYWYENQDTITAIFKTNFIVQLPYDPQELLVYAFIGIVGGLFGAIFVLFHRKYVLFIRQSKGLNKFLQKNRFIYPFAISMLISTVYFPPGAGQFLASRLTTRQQIITLFSNFTWGADDLTVRQEMIVDEWRNEYTSFYINLAIFMFVTFFFTIAASTLPVPSGALIPIFKMGAAFGRLIGEIVAILFPDGIRVGSYLCQVIPGGYAIVGAAAFSAGVTHSISICVVISEMTGQIKHLVPVMIAVLASNVVARFLQPSLYDSIIMIKKLPYLPDILPSRTQAYNIFVEDFMVRDVKYIWKGITFKQLRDILKEGAKIRAFPIVDNPNNMILLGSIQRWELLNVLDLHVGRERRLQVAAQWLEEARSRVQSELGYLSGTSTPSPPPDYRSISPPLSPPFLVPEVATTVPSQPTQNQPITGLAPPTEPTSKVPTRRPSRFEVIPTAPSDLPSPGIPSTGLSSNGSPVSPVINPRILSILESRSQSFTYGGEVERPGSPFIFERGSPRKSILKRPNSLSQVPSPVTPPSSVPGTPYQTVTGNERRIRQAFDSIFKRSNSSLTSPELRNLLPMKKVQLPKARVIDMSPEEQSLWEEAEMEKPVDLTRCHIDPAPFQLVERTTLLKVHALFSMMGVNHAYVTATGRLVGVVALPELRKAIENVNSGLLRPSEPVSPLELQVSTDESSLRTEEETPPNAESGALLEEQKEGPPEVPFIDDEGPKLTYEFDTETGEFSRLDGEEPKVQQ